MVVSLVSPWFAGFELVLETVAEPLAVCWNVSLCAVRLAADDETCLRSEEGRAWLLPPSLVRQGQTLTLRLWLAGAAGKSAEVAAAAAETRLGATAKAQEC